MAVIVNGDGILTGISSLATALTDLTSGRGTITGVTTVGTLQLGAGVSISSPRTQTAAIFTNNTEFLTVDDAGRVGVGTITPNSDAHPQNEKKINVGFITARSIAGDIDANTMVVAGVSTFVGALNATSVSGGTISGTTGTFSSTVSVNAGNLDINDSIRHVGDDNTKIRFPAADTFSVETAGSTRLHIHSDGRFRVGCTAQPSGTVGGFQLDMGSYPGTLRLMSGAGASGTQTASIAVGGSNHHANLHNGANAGGKLDLYNYNTNDGNSTAVSFHNSNGLAIARILGVNVSHSSRNGALVFMTSTATYPTEKMHLDKDGRLTIGDGNETASSYVTNLLVDGGDWSKITLVGTTTGGSTLAFSDGSGSSSSRMAGFMQMYHGSTDNGPRLVMGLNDLTMLHLRSPGSNRGQLELYGNFNESDTPAIEINDGNDARKVYLTNSSGDFNALTRSGSQTKGQLKICLLYTSPSPRDS
mgnify:CR=1 FL=1